MLPYGVVLGATLSLQVAARRQQQALALPISQQNLGGKHSQSAHVPMVKSVFNKSMHGYLACVFAKSHRPHRAVQHIKFC